MFVITMISVTAACASMSGSETSDWAKSYAYPLDEVWLAAEDAAAATGCGIEDADRERGRLRITSGINIIEMHFKADDTLVRVDAFVANTGQTGPVNTQLVGPVVESILNEISRILRERAE